VSDPGVALIELFAWMTDLLLYRVNQVPDRMYVKFLELIGVRLEPPRAARAPVTFYLSAAQPTDVSIPEGTEVATIRTETSPAIVFTTEAELTIRTPALVDGQAFTRRAVATDAADAWAQVDVARLGMAGHRLQVFGSQPQPGDAMYLPFERDHSQHVLAVIMTCELAGGAGIDPLDPPLAWEVWQGDLTGWVACEVEYDGTGGFNTPGEVILHTPAMQEADFAGTRGRWLRCRLTEAQPGQRTYYASPWVDRLRVEARGGTVGARHATTVRDEILGQSEGTPGQTFTLQHAPLLVRDTHQEYLVVESPGSEPEQWEEVEDFADSGPDDRHFTLDSTDGTLTLGPTLLQPDGTVYRFGATPLKRSWLRFSRYQHGGGVVGNVPRGTLNVLKTSIPYVSQVTNRQPAMGGRDAQTLDDAKLRAPQMLRTRTRAVTAEDYEYLALQVPGVARAHCLAPGALPAGPGDLEPGQVVVLVLPQLPDADARGGVNPSLERPELLRAVRAHLDERRVVGARLEVRAPRAIDVSVEVTLRVSARSEQYLIENVRRAAERALYTYLSPYTGGPDGKGWPMGRDLHVSEIYARLQRVAGVEYVDEVRVTIPDPNSADGVQTVSPRLGLTSDAVLRSGQHKVLVQ
ncbi:MAG: putative baseplate assembly protein, partial [Chloroflexi bacterium]|nr:putative baseplate assembly protein [Chloroflexota bacterium]